MEVTGTGYPLAGCAFLDIDSAVICAPGSTSPDCCHVEHDHAAAANACPRGHGECTLDKCGALTPVGDPCPGGHCAKGIEGCTGCRPLTVTVMPGSVTLPPQNLTGI